MNFEQNKLVKLCSFYVSDWHLVTMLLPYINKKINEQVEIATILENDLEPNIVTLVKKLNLRNKERILNLNWNKNTKIKNKIEELKKNEELIIFINGSKEFIKRQNRKIETYLQIKGLKNNIKIVNCFEITKFDGNITKILDEHDKILNTSGEKEITEIFEDYNKQEKKAAI